MLSYLVAAIVLFLITVVIIVFLRLSLLSLGILLIALLGSIGCAAYGFWWVTGNSVEYYTPGAILLAGGTGSMAICSIAATLIFSKGRRPD
ncbi:MAG: hypothetical protein GTO41_25685 [Burkholderiales bacterium]|nr:hypothetical protein [Burkholderiales bacterium]